MKPVSSAALELFGELYELEARARATRLARIEPAELRDEVALLLAWSREDDGSLDRPAHELLRGDDIGTSVGRALAAIDAYRREAGRRASEPSEPSEPSDEGDKRAEAPEVPAIPASIGRFEVQSMLGRGGMGVVYRARDPLLERTVAIKVLRTDIATKRGRERFDREAYLLARLDHPGIARILETHMSVGTEQPYIAMEYVEGQPLLRHARERKLDIGARLALFREICEAVQHAHQRRVIHRDLKPGNILVGTSGRPKILDFGIGLAFDVDPQATMYTSGTDGQGTLPYMSPEQIGGERDHLDIRTDVYSLGVVGYELLAGRLPLELADKSLAEAVHTIQSTEPPLLGTIDPRLRGDVELIFAKALEKDREERYRSVAELSTDLRYHLESKPIDLRSASAWYVLSRFARRKRVLVSSLAAIFLAVTAGLVGTGWGMKRALAAEARATDLAASESAQRSRAKSISRFLDTTLRAVDPLVDGPDVKLTMVLTKAAARIDAQFADEPEVRAALQTSIGLAFASLGDYSRAEPLLRSALATLEERLGPEHPDTVETLAHLGVVLRDSGALEEAEAVLRRSLALHRAANGLDHKETLRSMGNLAQLLTDTGAYDEAEALATDALGAMERTGREGDEDVLPTLGVLVACAYHRFDFESAAELGRELYRRTVERFGIAAPQTLVERLNLLSVLERADALEDAERLSEGLVDDFRETFGARHPTVATALLNVGVLYLVLDRQDECEDMLLEAIEIGEEALGREHPRVLTATHGYASFLIRTGRLEEAGFVLEELIPAQRSVLGLDHPDTWLSENDRAVLLWFRGEHDRATELLEDLQARQLASELRDHPNAELTRTTLAEWRAQAR